MLDAVRKRLRKEEPRRSDKILEIIEEEGLRLINLVKYNELEFCLKMIESTGWIFSYITPRKGVL